MKRITDFFGQSGQPAAKRTYTDNEDCPNPSMEETDSPPAPPPAPESDASTDPAAFSPSGESTCNNPCNVPLDKANQLEYSLENELYS